MQQLLCSNIFCLVHLVDVMIYNEIVNRMLWNTLNTNILLFLLSILYFFSFEFLFLFIDNEEEEAHDIAVT